MRVMYLFALLVLCVGCAGSGSDDDGSDAVQDADGDGHTDDCDDNDAAVYPGAAELCDGLDNDCNELVDDEPVDAVQYFQDADSDGFGDAAAAEWACEPPLGFVSNDLDCDDENSAVQPDASEICDDVDADCDGSLVDSGEDDCHALAACTDDGTGSNYSCECDSGYMGDGISTCDPDTFLDSALLSAVDKNQVNQWASSPGQVWTLCYRRSTDGASSSTFHAGCDVYDNTISVAQLDSEKLIGGYADESWAGSGEWAGTDNNFLFSLTQGFRSMHCTGMFSCNRPQYTSINYGPTFGEGHDWWVRDNMTDGHCNLGSAYACNVGSYGDSSCRIDFCGSYESWTIEELEVWGR